jgi:hypothetical protein
VPDKILSQAIVTGADQDRSRPDHPEILVILTASVYMITIGRIRDARIAVNGLTIFAGATVNPAESGRVMPVLQSKTPFSGFFLVSGDTR